jgi:hypothetical protein
MRTHCIAGGPEQLFSSLIRAWGFIQLYWLTRQGEIVDQFFNSVSAHSFDLSVWHDVQGFGIPNCCVRLGEINRNVWLAT